MIVSYPWNLLSCNNHENQNPELIQNVNSNEEEPIRSNSLHPKENNSCVDSLLPGASYSCVDSLGVPLDHKIINRIGLRNGIFIEVGANDGITQSNTKLLEEYYGWTGILIEPSWCLSYLLAKNRPTAKRFHCALGSFAQNNRYICGDFDGSLMASVNGLRRHKIARYLMLVRSLQSILDQLQIYHINFFSLDVEGFELNVLQGIDFNKTRFDYILIEIYKDSYDAIVELLAKHDYVLLENFANYNFISNPLWDGTHNDYLFQHK